MAAEKNRLRRIAGKVLGGLFLAAVAAMIVVASLPKPKPVDTATIERGVLEVTVDEDGITRVKDRYTISAPLSGNLARIEQNPGDKLAEGAVLARIVPVASPLLDDRSQAVAESRVAQARAAQRQARSTIARAEAAFNFATSERQRIEGLADAGGASQQALDQARFEERARREELASTRFAARVADHEVRMASTAAGRIESRGESDEQMEVTAPTAGQILRLLREDEGVISAGTPLMEIGDPEALEVVVDVLTADAVRIDPGAPVSLERWGGESALEGHVRRVEPSAFTETSSLGVREQRVNVVIDIDSEQELWAALGDGFRIEARIRVWREVDALKVPESALFRQGEGWAVYVNDGGVATRREVQLGRRNGIEAQVTGGLSEGDEVILHPSDTLVEGDEVLAN